MWLEKFKTKIRENSETGIKILPFTLSCNSSYIPRYLERTHLMILKENWTQAKRIAAARHKKILLGGRDTFYLYILACREKYENVVFDPRLSRNMMYSAYYKRAFKDLYPRSSHLLVDTGFWGSIPKALGYRPQDYILISASQPAQNVIYRKTISLRDEEIRQGVLQIEQFPSFWEPMLPSDIIQPLSSTEEFSNAYWLTILLYKDSTPREAFSRRLS